MPITVSCKCGKAFRVKDELAGKAVRCPNCKSPLRIAAGKSAASSKSPAVDEQAALLKFQEAQRKKQITAEEEAAARAEQKKLIESYDQLAGKGKIGKDGKKPERPTEIIPKKPTIFTKIADLFGAVFGTFLAKYVVIATLLSGGVIGSVLLVQYATSYVSEQSAPGMTNAERADLYMQEAAEDIDAGRWKEAKYKLDEIIRLNKAMGLKRDYRAMVEKVDKTLAAAGKK